MNIDKIADFAVSMRDRDIPTVILQLGRMCIVDWFGVALGAHNDETAIAVRRAAKLLWPNSGSSMVLLGDPAPSAAAALINGTMAHCLDYDDTHIASVVHFSSATLASALAVGTEIGASPERILRAFICGFEVGARLGSSDFGSSLNHRGWHSTGVLACLAATVAACSVYDLDEDHIKRALGAAATQIGGLTASFGTMSKPFHAGKAALNAVISTQLARSGFMPKLDLLEPDGGLAAALIQDGSVSIPSVQFGSDWELAKNTFKPYASCLLTHPVIDAARELANAGDNREIASIVAYVNPMTPKLAGKTKVQTPLEAKFSTAFCVAMALRGRPLTFDNFVPDNIADQEIMLLADKVTMTVVEQMPKIASRLVISYTNGDNAQAEIKFALGNPENPMSFDEVREKFLGLTVPVIGGNANALFDQLSAFGNEDFNKIYSLASLKIAA